MSQHDKPTVPAQVTCAITERVPESDRVGAELDRIAGRQYGKSARGLVFRAVYAFFGPDTPKVIRLLALLGPQRSNHTLIPRQPAHPRAPGRFPFRN